ncbi:MAG: hypothetical protein PVF73_10205, partial [Bacteroidales bacterium]
MRTIRIVYGFLVLIWVISCDVKKSNVAPEATFVRVYESSNIDEAYFPESVIELDNGNYLVLAALADSSLANFPRISVLALSSSGDFLSSVKLPVNYSNPVPEWIGSGDNIYFVCMDDVTLQAKLIGITMNGSELSFAEQDELESQMPLSAWNNGENTVILSYDRIGRRSVIDLYDRNFNPVWRTQIAANEDFESEIRLHIQRKGKTFPFFIGGMTNDG